MKLVWRRAVEARGLLLAAAVAALVAVGLVTGLSDYNRRAVEAGARAVLDAAPPEERSLLVSGFGGADAAAFAGRDRAVRAQFAGRLGGVPVTVAAARYGTGRELTGDVGAARTDDDPMFANLATLDDLPARAELTAGTWPTPGAAPLQVTVPEKVAARLGLVVGERVPLFDRAAERPGAVTVVGTWRPRDAADAYWRLAPGVGDSQGDAASTSYGPFALDPADFARTFPGSVSAAWLAVPDLAGVEPGRLPAVTAALADVTERLPAATGLGSSAQQVSHLDRLVDRLGRADLVGRSALLTPLLLIVVLGGYALVLVAALLNEDRRAQTALLRARGAARGQLAGLTVREATLVVAPAVLLAPVLTGQAVRHLGADLGLADGGAARVWLVALAAAVGCLLAMVVPALRRAGTYVADMAARSRPSRGAVVQRASVDVALVALAVLAWTQASAVFVAAGRRERQPRHRPAARRRAHHRCAGRRRDRAAAAAAGHPARRTARRPATVERDHVRHVAGGPPPARRAGAAARARRRRQHAGLVAGGLLGAVAAGPGLAHGRHRPAVDRTRRHRPRRPGRRAGRRPRAGPGAAGLAGRHPGRSGGPPGHRGRVGRRRRARDAPARRRRTAGRPPPRCWIGWRAAGARPPGPSCRRRRARCPGPSAPRSTPGTRRPRWP